MNFASRAEFAAHLAEHQRTHPRDLSRLKCPFCNRIPGAIGFVGHICHHLEELSLSALPQEAQLEEGSEGEVDDESLILRSTGDTHNSTQLPFTMGYINLEMDDTNSNLSLNDDAWPFNESDEDQREHGSTLSITSHTEDLSADPKQAASSVSSPSKSLREDDRLVSTPPSDAELLEFRGLDQTVTCLELLHCPHPGCMKSFGGGRRIRQGNLRRHMESVHGRRTWPCSVPGCGRVYRRKDTLQIHMRQHH